MKQLIYKGTDFYCPECMEKMYVPLVSYIFKNGGTCPLCNTELDKGENNE